MSCVTFPAPGQAFGLTSRERQVAEHVSRALTNDEIAAALCVKPETVKSHLHSITRKMGARNRVEVAVRWALHRQSINGGIHADHAQ